MFYYLPEQPPMPYPSDPIEPPVVNCRFWLWRCHECGHGHKLETGEKLGECVVCGAKTPATVPLHPWPSQLQVDSDYARQPFDSTPHVRAAVAIVVILVASIIGAVWWMRVEDALDKLERLEERIEHIETYIDRLPPLEADGTFMEKPADAPGVIKWQIFKQAERINRGMPF